MKKTIVQKGQKHVTILDVGISSMSLAEVLNTVRGRLTISSRIFVTTPNPEHVVRAQKDNDFRKILNSSDIAVPDGVGIIAADKFLSLPNSGSRLMRLLLLPIEGFLVGLILFVRGLLGQNLKVIKGRELFIELVGLANKKGWKVFLLGGAGDEAEKTVEILSTRYPKVKFKYDSGPIYNDDLKLDRQRNIKLHKEVLSNIKKFKPEMLFVALNAPKQEKWLHKYLPQLPVGLGMAVGGTFNYISGKSKLPPSLIESLGLEWLWRLITEPWRLGRVLTATVIFPVKVFLYKLRK